MSFPRWKVILEASNLVDLNFIPILYSAFFFGVAHIDSETLIVPLFTIYIQLHDYWCKLLPFGLSIIIISPAQTASNVFFASSLIRSEFCSPEWGNLHPCAASPERSQRPVWLRVLKCSTHWVVLRGPAPGRQWRVSISCSSSWVNCSHVFLLMMW